MAQEQVTRRFDRNHDPARVMALSDGVFAIVITLLVLEVHVPELGRGQRLADALQEIRPSLAAFLISFVVSAIAWTAHRDLFAHVRLTDRNLVWLNLLYLLPLSLLPFGAALISRYSREPVALRLYGFLLLGMALTRLIVWTYATNRPHLMYERLDERSKRFGALLILVPASLYVIAIALAGVAPTGSFAIYAGAPILYFVVLILTRDQAPPDAAERNLT